MTGVLLALIYTEGVAFFPKVERQPDYCVAAKEQQKTDDSASGPAFVTKDDGSSAKPDKKAGKSGPDSSDCVDWRTAVATEIQARYTRLGFWLVAFTLMATGFGAAAAWRTVVTMRDTGQRELRAYIAAVPTRVTGLTPMEQPSISFKITNHGTTPAHQMNHAAALRIEPHPLPADYPFPVLPPPQARPSIAVLHPDSALPYMGRYAQTASFTGPEIIEILQGHAEGDGRRLFAFIQVDYVDAFRRRHWTRLCISFKGRTDLIPHANAGHWALVTQGLDRHSGDGTFESANQHNETDYDD